MAKNIRFERFGETRFRLETPNGNAEVLFPLNGKHNIMNALSAVAVGLSFGMSVAEIAEALETAKPPAQRGEIKHFPQGFTVVDDSYNSNPDALLSMVKTIVEGGAGAKRKIVVAGEMRELGEGSERMHFETGEKIGMSGIDALFGVEGFAEKIVAGAKSKGLENVRFYENSEVAAEKFIAEIRAGDLILIKGSRGVKTEKILERISENFSLHDF
jgi:UDP-N-acetylmuramoyl-tripeptide--D-alanyl-D-alanine ligase